MVVDFYSHYVTLHQRRSKAMADDDDGAKIFSLPRRMTNEQYEAERAKIAPTRALAGVRWEQELATLFARSGWTQQELAKREGKSQQWVTCRMRFGRFLNFTTTVVNSENPPNNLTEGKFRGYWERTEKIGNNERERFSEVAKLMQADVGLMAPKRSPIGKRIVSQFADSEWHTVEDIATSLGETLDHTFATLEGIRKNKNYGCKAESKKYGRSSKWRIFKQSKMISSSELVAKLSPLIKDLKIQGKCNMSTMSPASVAILAARLQKLLDEWVE